MHATTFSLNLTDASVYEAVVSVRVNKGLADVQTCRHVRVLVPASTLEGKYIGTISSVIWLEPLYTINS